jgi:hypothetical protein
MEYHYAKALTDKNSLAGICQELEKKGFTVIVKSTQFSEDLRKRNNLYYTFLIYGVNKRFGYKEIIDALFFD